MRKLENGKPRPRPRSPRNRVPVSYRFDPRTMAILAALRHHWVMTSDAAVIERCLVWAAVYNEVIADAWLDDLLKEFAERKVVYESDEPG